MLVLWYGCVNWRSIGRRVAVVSIVTTMTASCQLGPTSPSSSDSAGNIQAELAFCADEVNRYRASAGLRTLTRSADLEGFAAQAAQVDALAHVAHLHFSSTNGAGTSMAETEILWWRGYSVRSVIRQGLSEMWHAGPSNSHYAVLSGSFSQVGCGIFINGTEVTVSQDFR